MKITRNLRNRVINCSTAISMAAMLAACSGGGGGGSLPIAGNTPLASGAFVKSVEGSGGTWSNVFDPTKQTVRYMFLYQANDIGGSGNIKGLRLQSNSDAATATTCANTTIRLGHTTVADLEATFDNNVEQGKGAMATVLDNATVTIPTVTAGDFFEIPFNSSFHYNGVDNLVVEIARSGVCSNQITIRRQTAAGYISTVVSTISNVADSGTISADRTSAKFVFGGGDNFVNPDIGSQGSNSYPFNVTAFGRKVQALHLAAEIDGSGPITGIGLPVGNPPADAQFYTVTIKMGHSTLSELADGPFDTSYTDTPVTVAENLKFQVPPGLAAGEVIWLPVNGTFKYNGVDNVIVEIDTTDNSLATAATPWRTRTSTGINLRKYGSSGSVDGTVDATYYPTEFRFHGSTIDRVVGAGGTDGYYIFPTAGRAGQYLYLASELGTSGKITRLACRMMSDVSTETVYQDFQIVMSHTGETTLGTNFAANVPNPMVVYSGNYTVPAGLIKGDWIEVPLTTAFNYNGTDNLVIQNRTSGGSTGHTCSVLSDAARYPSRRLSAVSADAESGGVTTITRDLRLWITK